MDNIYNCQKTSIKNFDESVDIQHTFRNQYIRDLIKLRNKNKGDTIVLAESFDFTCDGCPANFVQIFGSNNYIELHLQMDGNKVGDYKALAPTTLKDYKSYDEAIKGQYLHKDLKLILENIRKGKSLNKISSEYNTTNCYDGSNTLYTVIYPENEVACMKIRCWKYE